MEFIESETQMNNLLNAILEMESIPSPPLSPLYKSPQTRPTTSTPPPSLATSTEQMREVIYSMAAMQPIKIDPEEVRPPKRRNVKISNDPQSVAARLRRERISERIRILQRMVPGGTRMDTASMLDEVIHYVKFLKRQVQNGASSLSTPRSFNDRLLYLR